jgi:TolA-binding protein
MTTTPGPVPPTTHLVAHANGRASVSWQQVALAVVSAAMTLGTAWLAGNSSRSADTASRAVVITSTQLEGAQQRRAENEANIRKNEERLDALEKRIERLERNQASH